MSTKFWMALVGGLSLVVGVWVWYENYVAPGNVGYGGTGGNNPTGNPQSLGKARETKKYINATDEDDPPLDDRTPGEPTGTINDDILNDD